MYVSIPNRVLSGFRIEWVYRIHKVWMFQSLIGFWVVFGNRYRLLRELSPRVSIPNRVLGGFRLVRKSSTDLSTNLVSIPNRVLGGFRPKSQKRHDSERNVSIPNRVLGGFWHRKLLGRPGS